MKSISFVKENCIDEYRTILTPERVKDYLKEGLTIYAEKGIGQGIGLEDKAYKAAGAKIVNHEQSWTISDFVVKYKAPEKEDYKYFRPELHFASFLHAEGDYNLSMALVNSGVTAYAYEFVTTPDHMSPISIAPAEVAGKLAVFFGAYYLLAHKGGCGKLLANIPGASQCKIVIIGYGDAGNVAVRTASSLGAKVVVFGRNMIKLRKFQATVSPEVECYVNTSEKLAKEIKDADLVIGAILISTFDTEPIITEKMVKSMKKGSVIIDITAGYGSGYIQTFDQNTSLEEPVFEKFGVLHCKIDNICAASAITSSESTEKLVMPILIEHAKKLYGVIENKSMLESGLICRNGKFEHPELIRHMAMYERKGRWTPCRIEQEN